jgi:hypothetical protein
MGRRPKRGITISPFGKGGIRGILRIVGVVIGKIKKFITAVVGDFAEIVVGIEVPQTIANGHTIGFAICGNGEGDGGQ